MFITSDVKYIGAIVGRNTDNDGTVEQCYYLKGSADARGDNKERTALGTKKGALADGDEGTKTSSFTTSDYTLKRDCGYGKNLLDALNAKATEKGWAQWEESPNGYPVLKGLIRRQSFAYGRKFYIAQKIIWGSSDPQNFVYETLRAW